LRSDSAALRRFADPIDCSAGRALCASDSLKSDAVSVIVPDIKLSISPILIRDPVADVDTLRDQLILKALNVADRNRDDMSNCPVAGE
jgi:hypothetical protein